mgnify:FL=1
MLPRKQVIFESNDTFACMEFTSELIAWYDVNKRNLPWRNTRDPYKIWLSEIILQQTRVNQGMKYYHHFTEEYPKLKDLANASEEKVLKSWQGLGYYSRARNLHQAAKLVMKNFKGKFPYRYNSIITLPGVGEYTAAAIASFCFEEKHAVVDGNVFRFLSRHFGIDTAIDSSSAKKEFRSLAESLMGKCKPSIFNQAIMEFGALHCRSQNPSCADCPFSQSCYARQNDMVSVFPVKARKQLVRNRYFHYLVLTDAEHVLLQKRTGKDIWQSLYEFPVIESSSTAFDDVKKDLLKLTGFEYSHIKASKLKSSSVYRHVLSHQYIHAVFHRVSMKGSIKSSSKADKVRMEKLKDYPVPKLIEKYLLEEFEPYD